MRYSPFLGPLMMMSTALVIIAVTLAMGVGAVVAFYLGRRQ